MSGADQLERAERAYKAARAASDAATPGGLHGDPATVSGVRRKPNRRGDARRFAAYDREAAAARALADAQRAARAKAAAAERAAADAAAPCDIDSLTKGDMVRTRHGWRTVVRVSAKSVTVETEWSWTERIDRGKVIETRAASGGVTT